MKLEENYTNIEEQINKEEKKNRWRWVRIFIAVIVMITLVSTQIQPTINSVADARKKLVLQTGFPPIDHVTGQSVTPGKAAATAFSANPTQVNIKSEGWWDRLFPNRHVHLQSVQIPIIPTNKDTIHAKLSVCGSKKEKFGLGGTEVPDLNNCVDSISIQSEVIEEGDQFSVLEWTPEEEDTVVLRKSKTYWLVVESDTSDSFLWVYAQGGNNPLGTAYQTELGWEFKLEGEPIPSAMIFVQEHVKQ